MWGFCSKNTSYGDLLDSLHLRGSLLYTKSAQLLTSSQYVSDSPEVTSMALSTFPSIFQHLYMTLFHYGAYGKVVLRWIPALMANL